MNDTELKGNNDNSQLHILGLVDNLIYLKNPSQRETMTPQTMAAIIVAIQKMALCIDSYKDAWDETIQDSLLDAYGFANEQLRKECTDLVKDDMVNYLKTNIDFPVDVMDYSAARSYYEKNQVAFDDLYKSLGISMELSL